MNCAITLGRRRAPASLLGCVVFRSPVPAQVKMRAVTGKLRHLMRGDLSLSKCRQ